VVIFARCKRPSRVLLKTRALLACLLFAATFLAGAKTAHAILLSPPTEAGKFSLGATELWFHRDAEWTDDSSPIEEKYNLGAFWAKYGFHKRLTMFAEFALLEGDPHNEGVSYRYINLGVGANVLLVEFGDFYVTALGNYFENFQHDNQASNRHATTRHWAVLLQVGKAFPLGSRHVLNAWWAPAYISDEQAFDGGGYPASTNESQNNFGAAAGGDFLFWNHLEVFAHVVYADYFQPRLGMGYRF
jgi:hypothetical protein